GGGSAIFSLDLNGNHRFDAATEVSVFGRSTDGFVVGDWTNAGMKSLGVYRPNPDGTGTGYFSLDSNNNHQYDAGEDKVFSYGYASDTFIVGNWTFNPLTAAPSPVQADARGLTRDMLNGVVQQSLDAWARAGLDPQRLAQL